MMLRRALALVTASSVAFVSACAGGDSRETVVVTSVKWVNPDGSEVEGEDDPDGEKGSSTSDWRELYEKVLDAPGEQDFEVPLATDGELDFTLNGNYNYALVEANGGGNPELLLSQ